MDELIFSLQETDTKKDKLDRECAGKEKRLVAINEELKKARNSVEEMKAHNQRFSVELSKTEGELDDLSKKREHADSKLFNVTSAKQLDALKAQIEKLATSIDEQEAVILAKYEEQELLEERLAKMEDDLNALSESSASEISQIKELLLQMTSERQGLVKKRSEIVATVDEDLLSRYEMLYEKHKSEVVYETEDMVCPGCGMALARRLFDRMSSHRDDFYGCNSCGATIEICRSIS